MRLGSARVLEGCKTELTFSYVRSSGPGGQNINKLATSVQLRFNIKGSKHLLPEVKDRLARLGGKRVTDAGFLIIQAERHRTQAENRRDALGRFEELVLKALMPPTPRRPTRPTRASTEQRLRSKRRISEIKGSRRPAHDD